MALVDMRELLQHAHAHGYAIAAFDPVSLDFLQGIITAAERVRAPVILKLGPSHLDWRDLEWFMPSIEAAARRTSVPVAIHFGRDASLESAVTAIKHGCNGVMVDATIEPLSGKLETTRAVVDMAHACGVSVEGQPDCLPGPVRGVAGRGPGEVPSITPQAATRYVAETHVDFLAISIGVADDQNEHKPELDLPRLKAINETLGIPLIMHGGPGLTDDELRQLIANGVARIDDDAVLVDAVAWRINDTVETDADMKNTDKVRNFREVIAIAAERRMQSWGAAGRADDILSNCRSWLPVEHFIIYNVDGINQTDTEAMIAEGRRVLSAIPGVREIFTGEAIQDEAQFRYAWLVRFCHPAVIASYRENPAHVDFADRLFRPVAGKRISIDFQAIVP